MCSNSELCLFFYANLKQFLKCLMKCSRVDLQPPNGIYDKGLWCANW